MKINTLIVSCVAVVAHLLFVFAAKTVTNFVPDVILIIIYESYDVDSDVNNRDLGVCFKLLYKIVIADVQPKSRQQGTVCFLSLSFEYF